MPFFKLTLPSSSLCQEYYSYRCIEFTNKWTLYVSDASANGPQLVLVEGLLMTILFCTPM